MEDLEYVKTVVLKAGEIALKHFHNLKEIKTKAKRVGDYVSNADIECENFIKEELNKKFPGFSFLAEESGKEETTSDYQWVIDPIDGTANFLHGFSYFSCCVCLKEKNKPILSVVYFPALNELYYASRNKEGAFLEYPNTDIKTIKLNCSKKVEDCSNLIGYGLSNNSIDNLYRIIKNMPDNYSIRSLGLSSGDIIQVAKGSWDAFIKPCLSEWDTYPASYIAEKAGAKLYDIYGTEADLIENYDPYKFGTIVTTPKMMEELKTLIQVESLDNDKFIYTSEPYKHRYKPYWDKTKEVSKKIYDKTLPIIKLIWKYIKIGYKKALPYIIKAYKWLEKTIKNLYGLILEKIKK